MKHGAALCKIVHSALRDGDPKDTVGAACIMVLENEIGQAIEDYFLLSTDPAERRHSTYGQMRDRWYQACDGIRNGGSDQIAWDRAVDATFELFMLFGGKHGRI